MTIVEEGEDGKEYAIKLERNDIDDPVLRHEYNAYQSLACGIGIPRVYDYGDDCEYNFMVFDLLGPS